MMILVTGGARSGKSRHAEALIGDSSQVLYIATSQILDDVSEKMEYIPDWVVVTRLNIWWR